jgi:predicted nucleotidyltransferase
VRKLCRVDIRRSQKIFEKIERYRDRVVRKVNPQAIILFGSFARSDINEGSDVDIVVKANFKEPFLDRIKTLLDLNDGIGLPLEPVGYTPDEFRKMKMEENSFIEEVIATGKLIYGRLSKDDDLT